VAGTVTLVAFDPALRTTGVAIWKDGMLVDAFHVTPRIPGRGPTAWGAVAEHVWARLELAALDVDVIVLEGQVVYPRSKADPNDILQVTGVAGGLAALARQAGATVVHYDPAAWKGQAPKEVIAARSRARLAACELASVRKGATLDAWDAIGIGLHHLQRST